MTRKMLIDAGHSEETRVVIVEGSKVEDFDFETAARKPIRGNIYLAKVTRVEPSLQAAFVEYGGNRHGFLAFNEIHPDYYQIPYEDRVALKKEAAKADAEHSDEEDGDDDDLSGESARKRSLYLRRYKIQEVIKRRQILLVQVAKEERGGKGAALTTYISLAGRYCVLMPNTARGGGISRKINSAKDRKRLKEVIADFKVPEGMGLIVRTAGAARTKVEIRRDYDYLIRLWDTIRDATLQSVAPALIYEEGDLVKRAIRDLYDKDIESILVEGEESYKEAKNFIKMLMPSHAAKVQHYKEKTPLFIAHGVEGQLETIFQSTVPLKSGGYLVINPTEALVAIDVNSGRATRERNIEATALKTNLEAADEAARQMRLRDLAGLIVVDFIDMEDNKNNRAVEKRMADALKRDRARLQMGKISQFGLMEISRQRRRTSILEGSTSSCPTCKGAGYLRSVESSALLALRALEAECLKDRAEKLMLSVAPDVALYLLNEKRDHLLAVEARYGVRVIVAAGRDMVQPAHQIEVVAARGEYERAEAAAREAGAHVARPIDAADDEPTDDVEAEAEAESLVESETVADGRSEDAAGRGGRRRRRRRRGGRDGEHRPAPEAAAEITETADSDASEATGERESTQPKAAQDEGESDEQPRKRRRRGRRGGRGRRRPEGGPAGSPPVDAVEQTEPGVEPETTPDPLAVTEPEGGEPPQPETPPKRKRPSRAKAKPEAEAAEAPAPEAVATQAPEPAEQAPAKPARRTRKKKAEEAPAPDAAAEATPKPKSGSRKAKPAPEAETPELEPAPAPEPEPAAAEEAKPRRTGWWAKARKSLGGG
ncbi:MAG: Rne/Rng family ribonuclease [Maricaulaceae bacterium]|nr:Rne/Rng family ribonuclease [Maricaulaceae bacterium]